MAKVAAKEHRHGTHRAVGPSETVARLRPRQAEVGVTRVADITGLDRLGLPVVVVVRPRSRCNGVSQGKGLDLAAATASGLMEAIETWHAERIAPELTATFAELSGTENVVDVGRLPPRQGSRFHAALPIPWVRGFDLGSGSRAIWVPYALVHRQYSPPWPPGGGCFCESTNGLASGNVRAEAMVHAIAEVIERDALAIWHHGRSTGRATSRIDLSTIDDPDCVDLIAQVEEKDFALAVHDATSDVGVAVFHVELVERGERRMMFFPPAIAGSGCHPHRGIALLRALTEAAQSRLTYIAGSRDDLHEAGYAPDLERLARARDRILRAPGTRDFRSVESFDGATFEQDLGYLVGRLVAAGFAQIALVDLSRPDFAEVAVVRAVIPGLATLFDHPAAAPWPRVQRPAPARVALLDEAMM